MGELADEHRDQALLELLLHNDGTCGGLEECSICDEEAEENADG